MNIETILTPAELPALSRRDLRQSACVVFDILRATSTFVTALHHGATAIIPVGEINEAVALRKTRPDVLLAGERDGARIRAARSGGIDFDFGNSPREFTPENVGGKTIVSTTTNGTRALRACAGGKYVLAAAFLNLTATANYLRQLAPAEILLICAGTGDGVALEDALAAGAMVHLLVNEANTHPTLSDATQIVCQFYRQSEAELAVAIGDSQNGRRLLALPELRPDVAFCAQRDIFNLVTTLEADGHLRRMACK